MKHLSRLLICAFTALALSCSSHGQKKNNHSQPIHEDTPYKQSFSIKYYLDQENESAELKKAFVDRNNTTKILSSKGLHNISGGQLLVPGTIVQDRSYRPTLDKNIADISVYDNQFVYIDDKAVLSNAWAGELFLKHGMANAKLHAGGKDFTFMVSDGKKLKCIKGAETLWDHNLPQSGILDIKYDYQADKYWILTNKELLSFSLKDKKLNSIFKGENFTCFEVSCEDKELYVGTKDGYFTVNNMTGTAGNINNKVPVTDITTIANINGEVWFGSSNGAFMLRKDGKYNYYNGERWLPSNRVKHISKGSKNSVLILTDRGLGKICFKNMTLEDKAMFFEKQVRNRHIRNGFNASLANMEKGDVNTGMLRDSDNDGLWTAMYLGGQAFRYAVTKSEEALQNCRESLEAMERLFSINPVPGFPSRSFERSGYIEVLSDPNRWQHSSDPEWDWKATTSSDEAIGHVFAYGVMAELMDDEELKKRAVHLLDILMQHIIDNDFYLIDFDGKPTTWGRWHPDYVNKRPIMVGDRKLNSSNIIAMLQSAYHFTKKEIYKEKAFYLMDKYGYYENLMRPMSEIGKAPNDADDWSKMLSTGWNHSDDEMYFLGYWGLYRYAFNDTLKSNFKNTIIDHWEIERPEKEAAWNIFTALTGAKEFDLNEAIWWLQEHPLDLIDWAIMNSHRKDIEFIKPNFRGQTITEVLSPAERPIQRHNGNMFRLDRLGGNGQSEHSAGDVWLLPYWMGRYLGVISAPGNK